MKKTHCIRLLIALVTVSLISSCGQRHVTSKKKLLMGTMIEVVSPYPEAAEIVFDEIERVEKVFSTYIATSPVSHLNKTGYLNTNFEVAHLLKRAKEFYELSNEMFDVSIAPVSKLWKKSFATKSLPKKRDIVRALRLIGLNKIHIDDDSESIKFKRKGMEVDLGGIAKGYAIDAAVKELKRHGIDSAIINAGGDIFCLGNKFDRPWKVGLQHPRKKDKYITTLALHDQAVATSGDYQQFIKIGPNRYHHIINPKTGYPVNNDVVSVSVVAKDTVTADAVATCVFLLGEKQGIKKFQDYPGVTNIIVITKKDMEEDS